MACAVFHPSLYHWFWLPCQAGFHDTSVIVHGPDCGTPAATIVAMALLTVNPKVVVPLVNATSMP